MTASELSDTLDAPQRDSVQQRFWRRLFRHKLGMVGLVMLVLLVIAAVFAPLLAGIDPAAMDLKMKNKPPSAEHILGTDAIGRDVWARLVFGARVSLSVGLVAVGIYTSIALILGSVSGYAGGHVDNVIMRFTDIIMCFPTFLLIHHGGLGAAPQHLQHHGDHRHIWLARHDAPDTGAVSQPARPGLRYRRGCGWRPDASDHISSHSAQRRGSSGRGRHTGAGRCYSDRVEPEFSRIGRTAADAELGADPDDRTATPDFGETCRGAGFLRRLRLPSRCCR